MADVDPGTALFVGGFVAALFLFAAALTYVGGGGNEAVSGLALVLVGLGALFVVAGGVGAVVLRFLEE